MNTQNRVNLPDLVSALTFVVFGGWLLRETLLFGDEFSVGIGMDAATYPRLLAIGMLIFAVVLGVRAFFVTLDGVSDDKGQLGDPKAKDAPDEASPNPAWKVLWALISFSVYTFLLQPLGFLLATPFLLAATMALTGERRLWFIAVIAIFLTLAVWALSFFVFSVVLPEGPLRHLYS